VGAATIQTATDKSTSESPTTPAGGELTVSDTSANAFSRPAPNLDDAGLLLHKMGRGEFARRFSPAGATSSPGLGPIFNADACIACHPRHGRGRAVDEQGRATDDILLRLSIPGTISSTSGPVPVSGWGIQVQTDAVAGVSPEARVAIAYQEVEGEYADGTRYSLREPTYRMERPYLSRPADALLSPRVAPPLHGLGLLEAIPEDRLAELADPSDADGDGISGKLNRVWNAKLQRTEAGRFGWKATNPSLRQQTASAYHQDIGVTSGARPAESSADQNQYDGYNDEPEITSAQLDATVFFLKTLAVPARRDTDDPAVQRGKQLFMDPVSDGGAGCAACHTPTHKTAADAEPSQVAGQTIHPYTDLLLHDMGPALADDRPVFEAGGQEWRTPPLWGIGLTEAVSGHTEMLHDGRARSIAEAILWHGGEAEGSREVFRAMPREDREALLRVLRSL